MARKKKNKTEELDQVISKLPEEPKSLPYEVDEFGLIDWRKFLKLEYLALNRISFAKKGIDVNILSKEEIIKYKKESPDEDIVIKLAGFRLLAKQRGFISIKYKINNCGNKVQCSCEITWESNGRNPYCPIITSGESSASPESVSPGFQHSLEAIASNRAFIRAVREELNIVSVGEDEINPNEEVKVNSSISPSAVLERVCNERNIELATLNKFLSGAGLPCEWVSYASVPDKIALNALELINKNKAAKQVEDLM